MSGPPAQDNITIIDSTESLLSLIDSLVELPITPPSLYIDLEGIQLGRHGSISIVSLYVLPTKKVYLIDIYRLGDIAFSTINAASTSLKTILESPTIPKVIFDVRSASDALFSHYGLSVDGIHDLQLMELAVRSGSKKFVAGLAKCVRFHTVASVASKEEWQSKKAAGKRSFSPEKGGRYEVFNERPMNREIMEYCANDVIPLPELYEVYNSQLCLPRVQVWQSKVREATNQRIRDSKGPGYIGLSKANVYGPHDWELNDYDDVYDHDTARDCDGWEDDMIKNGGDF
ncbi:hypothetical protein FQN49_004902 [Arthroderma sp. PD_2]|nr:hypothetical protein FQN49_004902 [Arthroderma sp. PD_2]